ncbi:MAG: hypothetical protein JW963_01845 [Anaerolineales bacterium]|nr:hypothetical protein [Anaerolineales bacterium]
MSSLAYDTAWCARLNGIDWDLSNHALAWLNEHQLPDGSWGAEKPFYYHDRVISTLSAMIALTYRGRRTQDRTQLEKGLLALEKITTGATQGLQADPNGATVGFEMIVPTLVSEAERLGIIQQQGDQILGRMKQMREQKMSKLTGVKINRYLTPAFSAEMAGMDGQNILDTENLQEKNGSVANSPSATAFFVTQVNVGNERALKYLRSSIQEGGMPFAAPFDIFERAWVSWNLSLVKSLDPEIEIQIQPHIDYLEKAWKPGEGVGFSTCYTPSDGDDTSITFEVLTQHNRSVDIEAVFGYEEEAHFRCYPLEANSSVSVNVHALGALKQANLDKEHPSVRKAINYLKQSRHQGEFWLDKWNISPYYPTSHAIIACQGYDDKICQDAISWILRTQKSDGSWGAYGISTAEETAYCLQALIFWQRYKGNIPKGRIERGKYWLENNIKLPYPPLWIGKVLYSPERVVTSAILSALIME